MITNAEGAKMCDLRVIFFFSVISEVLHWRQLFKIWKNNPLESRTDDIKSCIMTFLSVNSVNSSDLNKLVK